MFSCSSLHLEKLSNLPLLSQMQCINRQSTLKLNALSRLENANLYSCISKSTQRGRLLKVNLVCKIPFSFVDKLKILNEELRKEVLISMLKSSFSSNEKENYHFNNAFSYDIDIFVNHRGFTTYPTGCFFFQLLVWEGITCFKEILSIPHISKWIFNISPSLFF